MSDIGWMQMWNELKARLSARTTWGRTQILDEMQRIESDKLRSLSVIFGDKKIVYAAGYRDGQGGYSMFDGPNPSLIEIHRDRPPDEILSDGAVIVKFEGEDVEEVYEWHDSHWKPLP